MTKAEKKLWFEVLVFMPLRFRKQHPYGDYIFDFYCPSANLVIEVDGEVHNLQDKIKSDKVREHYIKSKGFTILRFNNREVMNNLDGVTRTIMDSLQEYI